MNPRIPIALLVFVVSALGLTACGGTNDSGASGGDGSGGRVTLAAYSTPREAYEELIPAFNRTPEGRGVRFSQSYGSSGDQARAVIGGLRADVVALSLEPDVTKLVEEGRVARDWAQDEHDGLVTRSVVVLAVRPGNPERIRGWDDLTRDGVEVVTPNVFTSGGARWNVMAAYGSQIEQGRSPAQARRFLRDLFDNVVAQDKSARESLQTFAAGQGDVLLAYENEALTARDNGIELDYIVPDQTILIENPAAVTSNARNPRAANAFLDFLRTPEAQRVFVRRHYRPVVDGIEGADRFPTPRNLFTIRDLGGWERVMDEFFDAEESVMASIAREQGVSTGG
jgi:sulfate/thiosulfate transport system substrate-binding protein